MSGTVSLNPENFVENCTAHSTLPHFFSQANSYRHLYRGVLCTPPPHLYFKGWCFAPPSFLTPQGGWVLGTRVSDPLSVRSVAFCLLLAAALKTTLLRHGFYFHATVVFRCVLRTSQKSYSCTAGISACSSAFSKSQILCICSLYLLSIRLYSCHCYCLVPSYKQHMKSQAQSVSVWVH